MIKNRPGERIICSIQIIFRIIGVRIIRAFLYGFTSKFWRNQIFSSIWMIFRITGVRTTWVQLYIPQEVLNKIKDKQIIHNIFRTQGDDSIMFGYFCINFMEYMLVSEWLYKEW